MTVLTLAILQCLMKHTLGLKEQAVRSASYFCVPITLPSNLVNHHSRCGYWCHCSLGPGASYLLHLGLWVSAFPTVLAGSCWEQPGIQISPYFVPGVIRGQVSPSPSIDVTAIKAHTLLQHKVYKAVPWPEWHFQISSEGHNSQSSMSKNTRT